MSDVITDLMTFLKVETTGDLLVLLLIPIVVISIMNMIWRR